MMDAVLCALLLCVMSRIDLRSIRGSVAASSTKIFGPERTIQKKWPDRRSDLNQKAVQSLITSGLRRTGTVCTFRTGTVTDCAVAKTMIRS
jgi:hypothetical protein